MQTKTPAYCYYEAETSNASLLMVLKSIEEFIRYTSQHNISLLFTIQYSEKKCFACLHQSALIGCDAQGFNTIQD